jgi:hypothetical protein
MIQSQESLCYGAVSDAVANQHAAYDAVSYHRSCDSWSLWERVDAGVRAIEEADSVINEAIIDRLIAEIIFSAE